MPSVTIETIDTLTIRIPLDTWAPPPAFAGKPRTHVEMFLVRVKCSDGTVGWGECYGSSLPLLNACYRRLDPAPRHRPGPDRPHHHAAAWSGCCTAWAAPARPCTRSRGLDIALWDIRGKLEGVSVSKLLGGKKRDRVETYASLLQYNGNVEHVKRNTARALERGYRHIKLHERTAEAVAARARGDGSRHSDHGRHQLRLDARRGQRPGRRHGAVEAALGRGADLAAGGLRVLAALRKATGVPLAMGENATGVLDFRKMVAAGATDFVQPSIVKIGGLTNLWQVATEAEKAGVTCVPHAFFFGPGYLATLHAIACKERDVPLERLFADVGYVAYCKTVPDKNGVVEVPDRPGLGADPDEELITKFRV